MIVSTCTIIYVLMIIIVPDAVSELILNESYSNITVSWDEVS